MISNINFSFDFVAFLIGMFGAFIMEFIRIIRDNKSLTKLIIVGNSYVRIAKINKLSLLIMFVYIEIGGVISGIFANTVMEAFLYGVFWEALFTFAINNGDN